MRATVIRRAIRLRIVRVTAIAGAVAAGPAAAQDAQGTRPIQRWELEVHIGAATTTNTTAGTSRLPPAGTMYMPDFPPQVPAAPSRMVSSWYFGDGTTLFNQARRAVRDVPALVPLDRVLTQAGTRHRTGPSLGFRVARAIAGRFAAEFSFDAAPQHVRMTEVTREGIVISADSFQNSFDTILGVLAGNADSSAVVRDVGGIRLSGGGALRLHFTIRPNMKPYIAVGAGIAATSGDPPGATLVGRYRVGDPETTAVVDETDTVRIRYEERPSPIVILGGGITIDLTSRSGIRGDVRVHLGSNTSRIVVDATPSHAGTPSYSAAFIGRDASIVVATDDARQRSLSGPAIAGFETFTATGRQVQTAVTFGYFLRF